MEKNGKKVLAVTVENKPGVLARVAMLFRRRNYNISSLTVGETENPKLSRMTIVAEADDETLQQIMKQLAKLIEVIDVVNISEAPAVERELVFFKVSADSAKRVEIIQIADIFRARIVDVAAESLIIEITGDDGKINAITNTLKPYGILEIVRTGKAAIVRGSQQG